MIKVLAVILIALLYFIGGERGIITFLSLCWNVAVLSVSIIVMSWGWNPIGVAFISCLLISYATLFYQNGKNAKTIASFWSILLVLLILFAAISNSGFEAHIRGLNEIIQREDEVMGLTTDIGISMAKIAVAMIITGLIGAAMDTSIAVSSAVYEVYKNNRSLSMAELFRSGITIGRDILGATVNTVYFACLGEAMSLFILYKNYNYSLFDLFNSKAFFQQFVFIIFSCLSCVLVVPFTATLISYLLKNPEKLGKQLSEDELFAVCETEAKGNEDTGERSKDVSRKAGVIRKKLPFFKHS
jgi:uncharacterized membrane protein